ncbi:hypothetical protein [Streptomyces adelaidensis]|uniref:hypothetical protein n=1 Tax=Streptomyces adelaidensis TaxID=2796465 RepID=UPI001908260D|nr:hypothetical protein [Streptomyces adelaidensis]
MIENHPAEHCSDLLDDFLKKISQMEGEYLRAMAERCGSSSPMGAWPGNRVLEGVLDQGMEGLSDGQVSR